MAATVDPDNLPAGTQVGFYRVVRRVGAGGFGTLYEVDRDGKTYALKLSRERLGSLNPVDRARFEERTDREIAAVKQFSHPNIVKVQATDRYPDLESGHPYLVMDFVQGEEVRKWCASHAPSPAAVCRVFEKLARAVDYMHQRQVFHRDLKSENVLVRDDGDPVIIDFGVSRGRTSFRLTRHEAMVGTESHWAPEYLQHRETEAYEHGEEFQWTPATDLHSVGYMLYEALTGRSPFPFHADVQWERLWKSIQRDVPTPPSEVSSAVPRPLDAVVMRLLEKDPQKRQHSGQELAEELRTLLERHGRRQEWSKPLPIPAPAAAAKTVVRADAAAGGHPDLANIDALDESPIAVAAAKMVREAAALNPGSGRDHRLGLDTPSASPEAERRPPEASVAHVPAGAATSAINLREGLAHAIPERRSLSRPLVAGLIIVTLLLAASVVLAASHRSDPQRPTSLVAKVAREARSTAATLPAVSQPPAAPSSGSRGPRASSNPSAPSLSDARAIDRELEARYGGRPTITPDGAIRGLPSPTAAPADAGTSAVGATRGVLVATRVPMSGEASPAAPSWLKRSTRLDPKVLVAQRSPTPPKPLGIPTGAHIPARLLTTLDSRTVGSGPVEARLSGPFVLHGDVVLPAGTLAFGRASGVEGRFVVRFEHLRLPDDVEIEFAAIAMDHDDGRPGLPVTRRMPGQRRSEPEGVGFAIARNTAETVLGTVTGGLPQELVRGAGQVAIQARPSDPSGTTDVLILDPGLVFDLWVERPF
jgi:tRNA A-37 threonylcarbamoyl transferase component Bud32